MLRPMLWWKTLAIGTLVIAFASFPTAAEAGATHVVTKGQTVDQVARKYGVSVKELAATNRIKDPSALLKAGSRLQIPTASGGKRVAAKSPSYVATPKHPGRIKLVRFGTSESIELQLVSKKGKLTPGVLPKLAKIMRFAKLNMEHAIDARLVAILAQISDHFGGRPIEIVSGFRPKTRTQYAPHSNHNVGRAIDMRIPGVPNEVVRDHCRTFRSTGVGYYPNSLFVHFDVRQKSTFWVDLSKPGEPPKYVGGSTDADHAVDDLDPEAPDRGGGREPEPAAPVPTPDAKTPSGTSEAPAEAAGPK